MPHALELRCGLYTQSSESAVATAVGRGLRAYIACRLPSIGALCLLRDLPRHNTEGHLHSLMAPTLLNYKYTRP